MATEPVEIAYIFEFKRNLPSVILITIYSKSEQADISVKQIQQILKEFQEASEDQ